MRKLLFPADIKAQPSAFIARDVYESRNGGGIKENISWHLLRFPRELFARRFPLTPEGSQSGNILFHAFECVLAEEPTSVPAQL